MSIFTQNINPITGIAAWEEKDPDYDYYQEIARSAFAESENGVLIDKSPEKCNGNIKQKQKGIKKKKKSEKSRTNKIEKAVEDIRLDDTIISQNPNSFNENYWEEILKEEDLYKFKINMSSDPTNLEVLNKNTLFEINLKKLPQNELSKAEMDSVADFFKVEFVENNKSYENNSTLEIVDETPTKTFINNEADLQKIIDGSKTHFNSDLFDTEEFKTILGLYTKLSRKPPNVDVNERILYEALCWKNKLTYEINLLELLLPKSVYENELCVKKFFAALRTFYLVQKKALMCIYPEVRDEDEIKDTYLFSEDNQNANLLKMYHDIENFKSTHLLSNTTEFKSYFPYPRDFRKPLPNLMLTKNEISEYVDAIRYLKNNFDNYEMWLKLRTTLSFIDHSTKQRLSEIIANGEELSYDELGLIITFDKHYKGNGTSSSSSDLDFDSEFDFSSDEFSESEEKLSESIVSKTQDSNKRQNKFIPLVTNNISYNNAVNKSEFHHINKVQKEKSISKEPSSATSVHRSQRNTENFEPQILQSVTGFHNTNDLYNENTTPINENYFQHTYNQSQENNNGSHLCTSTNESHQCYGMINYSDLERSYNSDLESFFRDLRHQTDQIHLQEYYYHMFSDS